MKSVNIILSILVRCAGNTGIMFLNEVALGKEHHIIMDDWTLKAAPSGYDCIIAKGWTEPGRRERERERENKRKKDREKDRESFDIDQQCPK